jgi:16S rRNA (cytosine1402-N4)-methyltransferase
VLVKEVLDYFASLPNDSSFLDCTAGEGGHSEAILQKFTDSKILLNDRDSIMLERATERLSPYKDRIFPNLAKFSDLSKETLPENFPKEVDGILLDFGISTYHLVQSGRGFSFKHEEPLDMRLSTEQKLTAREVLNKYNYEKLFKIFREYGEENWTKKILEKLIVQRRKKFLETTTDLAKLVESAIPRKFWPEKTHPSFRIFQAVRIEVNSELDLIQTALRNLPYLLKKEGVMIAISFHSLEDRIVKTEFKELEKTNQFEIMTKKPILPSEEEILLNFASRSAKLRAIKRI